ncbi:MAG: flavin reductase [Myxococcota bacterium]
MSDTAEETTVTGDGFEEVPLRPHFFMASAFFPMPVLLASTRDEEGRTNLAPYSICFPEPSLGDDAMVLSCRPDSNTARNIRRSGRVALNFIPDAPHFIENLKELGIPGATPKKMGRSIFRLAPSDRPAEGGEDAPDLVDDAVQVFECTWDREHTVETAHEDLHFVLRVERILLKARWRRALESGEGVPRLPVDYGFRAPTSTWLSRPMTRYQTPRLRPKFELTVPYAPDSVVRRFRRALTAPNTPVVGNAAMEHVQLFVPERERTFWSPHVDLMLAEDPEGARLFGRIGPHPSVWTLFVALHAVVGFTGLGGLMFGLSQLVSKEPAWALWVVPAALALHVFIAGAAFIGQGLGADQIHRLRVFIEDTLAT